MNKETYSYYKRAYRANKAYRDKIGRKIYGDMLEEKEWNVIHQTLSNREIVYNEFHNVTKDDAIKIQNKFKEKGIKMSIISIQSFDYSDEAYDLIKDTYQSLIKSKSSKDAAKDIAYMYYGS